MTPAWKYDTVRRVHVLGAEKGIFVWDVNPCGTSQTCARCGHRDRKSRLKLVFHCTACESRTHADINAARVIGQRGTASIRENAIRSRKRVCA